MMRAHRPVALLRAAAQSTRPRRQRGAALLLAMLIVALVASLAAAATWQQYQSVQAEADERAQMQARWLITGALDWGKIVLYLDARASGTSGPVDHLNEPWSVPLEEAKLGTFLTAENNVAQNANADLDEAFFSGGIVDLNSRLNVTNLVNGNQIDPVVLEQFQNLFSSMGIEAQKATELAQNYLNSRRSDLSENVALTPTCTQELTWLGLSPQQIQQLEPYITVLPKITPINFNTASERVLAAALLVPDASAAAARIAAVRNLTPFKNPESAKAMLGEGADTKGALFSVSSNFFLVSGQLRLEGLSVNDRYVLYREGQRLFTARHECDNPAWNMESDIGYQ